MKPSLATEAIFIAKGGIHEYGKVEFDFEKVIQWLVENLPLLRPIS
jgi:hypothetical protein